MNSVFVMEEMQSQPRPVVAILPSPGMGHLIPLVEFAKQFVGNHRFSATFIIPGDGPPSRAQKSVLEALPPSITHVFLPPVSFHDLPDDAKIEIKISLTISRSLSAIRGALRSLAATANVVTLIVDLFGTDAFDVAREFGISPYIFFPSTAMMLSLFLHLPELDAKMSCEYRDLPELVMIPGCTPIHGKDLLDPLQERKNEACKWVLHHAGRYRMAEGIMVNSFQELEPGALKVLQEAEPGKPPVYPIGPLVNLESGGEGEGLEPLRWLDEQPGGSVLYVSFGSGGTLSQEQMNELALGLEMSQQRFLWVVRSPSGRANATYFSAKSDAEPFEFLPKGFLDRTGGRGLVVPSWAPQAQVLRHASTGGFLTHCGWNSILESVVNGVPLIAWPLYAEQKMNAAMLTEDVMVALRPRVDENGLVGRDEVTRVVTALLEGQEGKRLSTRMKELKEAAAAALSERGSSTGALSELAIKWRNRPNSQATLH